MPWRSCAFGDCSGSPATKYISAMTTTPAHPPPKKPATTHQNETILLPPFPWSRESPGTDTAPWLRCSKKNGCAPGVSANPMHRRRPWVLPPRAVTEPRHGTRVATGRAICAAFGAEWTKHLRKGPAWTGSSDDLVLRRDCHQRAWPLSGVSTNRAAIAHFNITYLAAISRPLLQSH